MFPYFEMYKNAVREQDVTLGYIIHKHFLFFFVLLPVQVAISVYLTGFEFRKLLIQRNAVNVMIVFYNFWQVVLPVIDLAEYLFDVGNSDTAYIVRTIQYGVNANFVIMGLIVLLYKIKYLNVARFYISRFYQVIIDVKWLVVIIFIVEMTFAYAYKIIYSIQADHEAYGMGIIFKAFEYFNEDMFTSLWALWQNNNFSSGSAQT